MKIEQVLAYAIVTPVFDFIWTICTNKPWWKTMTIPNILFGVLIWYTIVIVLSYIVSKRQPTG